MRKTYIFNLVTYLKTKRQLVNRKSQYQNDYLRGKGTDTLLLTVTLPATDTAVNQHRQTQKYTASPHERKIVGASFGGPTDTFIGIMGHAIATVQLKTDEL